MRFLKIIFFLISFLYPNLSVEKIPFKFDKPIYVSSFPDKDYLVVVEQKGVLQLIDLELDEKIKLLDITDRVHKPLFPGDERGLLGFTFDPHFKKNNYFYVNYVNKDDYTIVSRFKYNSDKNFSSSEVKILELKQPYSNHNGGCIEFGPDGNLYISVGDGGSAGDPEKRAQDLSNLFGTILRIKINEDGSYSIPLDNPFIDSLNYKSEIWSYGLRNVWRFSFDSMTGDLVMGDVGQHLWEEINFASYNSNGGENYGWNILEGNHCYPEDVVCDKEGYVEPLFEYPNNANYVRTILGLKQKDPNMDGCSITGGYVYRGKDIPYLYGRYIFGDYCTGKVWSINTDKNNLKIVDHTQDILSSMGKQEFYLSSFGQDNKGEILLVDYNGTIYKLKNLK